MTDTISRRRLLAGLAALPAGLVLPRPAAGQSPSPAAPVRIGLVVPPASVAAEQARLGARLGLEEGNTFAEFFGKTLMLLVEEAASPEEASQKGAALVQRGGVVALVGGLDEASARALRGVAAQHRALFLNIGSRADELRAAACHRRMFHIQPSDTMYVEALGRWLIDQKKLTQWAVLAADSPRGRALREAATAVLARGGGKPVAEERVPAGGGAALAEALGRAAKSGAQVVFLAVDSEGQLAAARAARRAGLGVPLAGPGLEPGEFLSRDLLGVAGFWSTLWYHEWTRFSARELNRRFRAEFDNTPMQGIGWAGWAAVRLLAEAAVRAEGEGAAAWARFFASDYPFDGHKGEQLTIRPWDHQLRVTFGIVSPRGPEKVKEDVDIYDTLTDSTPRDPVALDPEPGARRCRFES